MAAAPYAIRVFGDPVLKHRCTEVDDVDETIRKLTEDMITTMYDAPGVGLAAPQIGVQKRFFVYDDGDGEGARTMINPEIIETSGEFLWDEGCLSVPGIFFPIERPNRVRIAGVDVEGHPVEFVADGFLGRILQHEVDHLNGTLMLDRLNDTQRKQALRELRERDMRQPPLTNPRQPPKPRP